MMKVALVHDWLTGMRGGERCLESFCELFPQADLFTLLYVPGTVSSIIAQRRITTSFIQRLPMANQRYRYYLPLFPAAIERLNVQDYDLVISSSHCVAKGVRVPTGGYHLSYVYTPMRYIWDQYETYFAREKAGLLMRALMRVMRPTSANMGRYFKPTRQPVRSHFRSCRPASPQHLWATSDGGLSPGELAVFSGVRGP